MATRRSPRRVLVSEDVESIAVAAHDLVGRIEPIEKRLDGRTRAREIPHEHTALGLRAFVLRHEQEPPIVGHLGAEEPVGMIGPFVDERVGILRRAQLVEVDLLIAVRRRALVARLGRLEARVIEPGPVLPPRRGRELRPPHEVAALDARRHLEHPPLAPVQSAPRQAVGHQPAVVGARRFADRNRAVRRERVWIDQHVRHGVERPRAVDDGLVLQAVVLREDVVVALARGQPMALIVPELGEARAQRLTRGYLREVREGERVLRGHPLRGLRAAVVLEPAIGIGNRTAEVVVSLIDTARGRVLESLRIHSAQL